MSGPIRIVLVDDHAMVREAIRRLLSGLGVATVVGEAASAEQALIAVDFSQCDVAVVDVSMPGQDGLWLTERLRERYPYLPVLMLSMHEDDDTVVAALKAGANGYVLKSSPADELVEAIEHVHQHGFYHNPRLARPLIRQLRAQHQSARVGVDVTDRELAVLRQAAEGLSNREVGVALQMSESTVKSHLRSIYRKLAVRDRATAILHAIKVGWIRRER